MQESLRLVVVCLDGVDMENRLNRMLKPVSALIP